MATPNAWKLLTPEALAQAKAAGMNLATMSPAEVTQLNAEIGGTASENAKGLAFYEAQGVAAEKAKIMRDRPPPSAQPSDQAAYLRTAEGAAWGPVHVYPEFGWTLGANGSASAGYDLGNQNHVTWSVSKDGSWSYDHTWGGFNLGRTLDGIANGVGIVAASMGLVGAGQLVYALHALAGHASPDVLAAALKADYNNFQMSGGLAQAVQNGDWGKVWNVATSNAENLGQLATIFSPTPAPDEHGNLTITSSGGTTHTSLIPSSYHAPTPTKANKMNLLPLKPFKALSAPKPPPASVAMSLAPGAPPPTPPPAKWYQKTITTVAGHPLTTGEAGAAAVVVGVVAKLAGWL